MRMQIHAANAITDQFVIADPVIGYAAGAHPIGKKSDAGAANGHAVALRSVIRHGVLEHSIVCVETRRLVVVGSAWMRRQHDSALKRIVDERISRNHIVLARSGFVADQETVGVSRNIIPRNGAVGDSDQMNRTAAVAGFVRFINGLARASMSRAAETQARILVIVNNVVIANGDIRGAHRQDAFILRVFDGKSADRDELQPGMAIAIDQDAILLVGGIDDRISSSGTQEQ